MATTEAVTKNKYKMTISRLTVDKLGVKLYDKVSAVIAELVANSYDADATSVTVVAPMGELLATKHGDDFIDKGYVIEIRDNGVGMTPQEINDFYLRVGAERRNDPRRGDISKKFGRKVMGRKGVGKLAPFGICQKIEILSSGGIQVAGKDETGHDTMGYLTAHLIMDRESILYDTDSEYHPDVGSLDGIVRPETGTTLKLTNFAHRIVPDITDLSRQLAQRFGIQAPNWEIKLIDNLKKELDPDYSKIIGSFAIETMEDTVITFDVEKDIHGKVKEPEAFRAFDSKGRILPNIKAGFDYEGRFYPLKGWMAYSKDPYKDDLMAGVRIYCRGKIASKTAVFNRGAGFTGEYDIRSYLVGEIHADWLDEGDDLISTDRRDILWSHELGHEFEVWGQAVVLQIGKAARNPIKKKVWDIFRDTSKIEEKIAQAFPSEDQKPIREKALEFAQLVGRTMREEEARDPERTDDIVQLSLTFAPHITLDNKLRQAAEAEGSPLAVIAEILKTARIAELSSFGQIAYDRIKVIERIESLKDDTGTLESAFQELIEQTPWLIDSQWSPITANQSFSTLKKELQKYFSKQKGIDIDLEGLDESKKRADFVLLNQDSVIQIVEIKKPNHAFQNEEMERLNTYAELMQGFLEDEANKEFTRIYKEFHITLVCDGLGLNGVFKTAFDGLKQSGQLTHIGWSTFLLRTKRTHQDFLNEADRQRKLPSRETKTALEAGVKLGRIGSKTAVKKKRKTVKAKGKSRQVKRGRRK